MAARKQQCQTSVYREVLPVSCCASLKYSRWYSDGRNQTYLCLSLFMAAIWSVDLIWWLACEKINPSFLLSWVSLKLHWGCCGWLGICISPPRSPHAGGRQWDFPRLWARCVTGKGKVLPEEVLMPVLWPASYRGLDCNAGSWHFCNRKSRNAILMVW